MISKKAFQEVNGFDVKENGIYTSIDFCLKQIENGKQINVTDDKTESLFSETK